MPLPIPANVPPVEPLPRATGTFVSDGLTLTYELHGERGPCIIFHPGVGFSRVYFRPLVGMLAPHFRCVLLDPRGVAQSEAPASDDEYDVPFLARDLARLAEHLGENRVWLFGHSLGANVCVEASVRYPEMVERLIITSFAAATELVEPFVRWVRSTATPAQSEILDRHESAGPVLHDAGVDREYGEAAGRVWNPHVLRQVLSRSVLWNMGQYERPAGALWGRDSAIFVTGLMTRIDQRSSLRQLRCPVHLFYGRYDQYAASTVPLARALVPDLSVHELSASNHHSHVEEPARIADALLSIGAVREEDALALRSDVKLVEREDGAMLVDEWTEAELPLGEVEAGIVRHFGVPLERVVGRTLEELGDEYDAEQVHEAVESFVQSLSDMGLLDEQLSAVEIEARQRASREALLERERWHGLRAAVEHAVANVPFHRERFAALGLGPDVAFPGRYTRLPSMTKADIRANFPDRLVPDGADLKALLASGELSIGTTSGSTDERLQVLFDYQVGRLPTAYNPLWRIDPTVDLVKGAVFTSPVCAGFECHLGKLSMEERTRETTLTLNSCDDPMSIRDEEVRAIAEELRAFEPDVLFANPWYAVCFLKRAQALDLELPFIRVVLSSYQYLTLRHRRLMEEGFGTKVFSYYGATDLGGSLIGVECARGHMHVREDHVFCELVPPREAPEAFGDLGMLTVTTLNNKWMPLLRYEVGDLAREAPPCDCEGGLGWRCITLEGRLKDVVFRPDGTPLTTRQIDDVIGGADLDFYCLSQEDERFTLEAIPAESGDVERVKRRLSRLLGPGVKLEVDIVRTLAPERSLKFRQTVSRSPGPPRSW